MLAYCLAGHVREYENTLTQPSNLFKNQLKADFFISTWELAGKDMLFWQGGVENDQQVDPNSIHDAYSPVKMEIEKRSDYDTFSYLDYQFPSHQIVNVLNTLLMFKKIKRSFELTDERYDTIVRSRFDLTELVLPEIEIEDGKIYGKLSSMNGFTSDIFFLGNRETMLRCIPDESFYTEEVIQTSVNAEHIFQRHMVQQQIEFVVVNDMSYVLKNGIRY